MSQLLTVKQVVERINSTDSTIYSWASKGVIPSYKIGGLLRFDPEEIEEYIKNSKVRPDITEKIATRQQKDCDGDDIFKSAVESVLNPSYNTAKGKLGLDKVHKKGGNYGAL